MNKIVLITIVALLSTITSTATVVSGICKSYAGEKIELVTYVDLFNNIEVSEGEQIITEDGSFSISFPCDQTKYISIKIRDYKSSFYVTADGEYKIMMDKFDSKSAPPLSPYKFLQFDFIQQDKDSINFQIIKINQSVSVYQRANIDAYINNRIKVKIPELESLLEIDSTKKDYINQYKKYVIGRQKLLAKFPQKEVFEQYLKPSYEPQNIAYIELFTEFYHNWFDRYISFEEMRILDNSIAYRDIDSLLYLMKQNDFLQNDLILENVLANELYRESLLAKRFERDDLVSLLDSLKSRTSHDEVKASCDFYLQKVNKLKLGSSAPDFNLINTNSEEVNLKSFEGKYLYLGFWSSNCKTCIKSMSILNDLYPKYRDSIEFVSINIDDDYQLAEQVLKFNEYNWTFLKGGGNYNLRNDYNVSGLPLFYFLGKHGTILQSPAEAPGEGIELLFKYLFDSQRNTQEKIWDWNKPIKDKK